MEWARDETLCKESRSVALSSSDICVLVSLGNSHPLCYHLSIFISNYVVGDVLILLLCKDLLHISNKKSKHLIQR